MEDISRRDFMSRSVRAAIGLAALTAVPDWGLAQATPQPLVVVRNGAPGAMARKAVEALGGMGQFVKKGQSVLVKPNIGWDRVPQQAATTNPDVVAEVVKMCLESGASRVRVLDRTCNEPRRCYLRSGIEAAAKSAGAEVRYIVDSRFKDVAIPNGELIKSWPFYLDALESDVCINVPIAKHHSMSRVTLGFKNLMGLMGGDRGELHNKFMTKIVDLNMAVKPSLTIIDAYRVLMRNGPTGGNLADVSEMKTVMASTDRVAIDAFALKLFGVQPREAEFITIAAGRGMGIADLARVKITELNMAV